VSSKIKKDTRTILNIKANLNKKTSVCELISLHGLYLEEQGTRSAAGSVFRRGNGSLSEPLANGLMDRS